MLHSLFVGLQNLAKYCVIIYQYDYKILILIRAKILNNNNKYYY